MSITSFSFIIFIFATLIVFYVVPKRCQWTVLLVASIVFYLACGTGNAIYVLITAITVYVATRYIGRSFDRQKTFLKDNKETLSKEQKKSYKRFNQSKRKAMFIGTVVINVGILCVFKYTNFALEQIDMIMKSIGLSTEDIGPVDIIAPLGISYYTFQSVGYLVDVYWGNIKPQENFLKHLLFITFFPGITQGPISEYEQLSEELFKEHNFSYKNYSWGFQRIVWGFMKKLILANIAIQYGVTLYENYPGYSGITVYIGILIFTIGVYADFAGYMDIMCGLCEMLDIRLAENFRQPFFAKSISELWRRWHITLGNWLKKYIFYPISMSRWNISIGIKGRKAFGDFVGTNIAATISLAILWFLTGLWHGASWNYVMWGLFIGFIITMSMWLEPLYIKGRELLRIKDDQLLWKAIRAFRTLTLFGFAEIISGADSLKQGFGICIAVFRNWGGLPTSLSSLFPYVTSLHDFALVLLCIVMLFVFSWIERKKPVRHYFNKIPCWVRVIILVIGFMLIVMYGIPTLRDGGGFMYAQF